jgi:hypothetical protein
MYHQSQQFHDDSSQFFFGLPQRIFRQFASSDILNTGNGSAIAAAFIEKQGSLKAGIH